MVKMNNELIELCPICIESQVTYFTECNHGYCISCLCRIKKCAMCRNSLQRNKLCIEIKQNVILINNTPTNGTTEDINIYNFSLNLDEYQPSGTTSFSRIEYSLPSSTRITLPRLNFNHSVRELIWNN